MSIYRRITKPGWLITALPLLCFHGGLQADSVAPSDQAIVYESNNLTIGVGLGLVEFDSNVKVSDQESGGRRYVDLEGNLDLPEHDEVKTLYGAYRFNDKHSVVFGYFSINRQSTVLDLNENFDDIILLKADVRVEDSSRFYNIGYGYNLFRDDRSSITLVAGLNTLDLELSVEASGELTVLGVTRSGAEIASEDVLAPLPLFGLNFGFSFTPKWSISTRIALVTGSYQDVSASVTQTSITSLYKVSEHVGFLMGLTYFDANVEIDDDDEITDISYGYDGAFIGVHFGI